jgi:hypothetical protein
MNRKITSNINKVDSGNRSNFEGIRNRNLIEKRQKSCSVARVKLHREFILFILLF